MTMVLTLYGRHHNLLDLYEISISQLTMDLIVFTKMFFFPLSVLPDLTVYMSNTTGSAYLLRAPESNPGSIFSFFLLCYFV